MPQEGAYRQTHVPHMHVIRKMCMVAAPHYKCRYNRYRHVRQAEVSQFAAFQGLLVLGVGC